MKLNFIDVRAFAVAAVAVMTWAVMPAGAEEPTGFQEVFSLIRSNLVGVSAAELDRAAVQGLLQQLQGRVVLLTNETATGGAKAAESLLGRTNVLEDAFGYVRVDRVEKGLAGQLTAAHEKLNAARRLKGLIVDLRFAGGLDYLAAVATAEKFLANDKPLLQIEGKVLRSTATNVAIAGPLVVLVNRETTAAAETLAAILRKSNAAMIIGGATPGQAGVFMEYPLKNGQRLRLASGMVRLGDGTALTGAGLKPDVSVEVKSDDERAYIADPFTNLAPTVATKNGTAAAPRHRMTEAELVRRQREGGNTDEDEFAGPGGDKGRPIMRDPALARAVDILKGIVLLKAARAN